MKRTIISTLAALATLVLLSAPAQASVAVMNLNGVGSTGTLDFTSTGAGNLAVCPSGCTISGTTINAFSPSFGEYTLSVSSGTASLTQESAPNQEYYTFGAGTSTLTFSYADGTNSFTADLTINTVKDSTPTPQLLGSLSNVSFDTVGGSMSTTSAFKSIFQNGTNIDWTLDLTSKDPSGNIITLDDLWAGNDKATSGTMSDGELTPVPEPASMLLLGSGLLGLGFLRRKIGSSE